MNIATARTMREVVLERERQRSVYGAQSDAGMMRWHAMIALASGRVAESLLLETTRLGDADLTSREALVQLAAITLRALEVWE